MKVEGPVTRVVDQKVKVRRRADSGAVDIAHVKMSLNFFGEIGVEDALRL